MSQQPPFFSDKQWASLADAYQSYYFDESKNKNPHPLDAFSDGVQHGARWIGFHFAHWAMQEGYESFLGGVVVNDNFFFQMKWVNKHGFPISADDLYEKFCKHAKTIF